MKAITNIKELRGKTIESAVKVDHSESVALLFTDDTYAYFDVEFYGDCHDMYLRGDPSNYLKKEAGIISESEYNNLLLAETRRREDIVREREMKMFEDLKAKYG